jgi:glyoxylase-like metal-dependent hydrolase (beta-lactamase superfamily II)
VLDLDEKSGATATRSADLILDYVDENGLIVEWILDTHLHADHFSAARYLSESTGAPTGIGEHVVRVQALWKRIYNWPAFPADGSQWNRLFKDGERFRIGQLDAEVIFSPGHTPASITYLIGDAAFIHDTIFMLDRFAVPSMRPPSSPRHPLRHQGDGCIPVGGSCRKSLVMENSALDPRRAK